MRAIGGKGSGRPPTYKKAFEALSRAMAVHGESSPVVKEAMEGLLGIMRDGGPYARVRMQAITRMLDMFVGRPREASPHKREDPKGAIRKLVEQLGDEHGPEAT